MVELGLQVRFNSHGCFVEDMKNNCCLVAKGNRKSRMFSLDARIPKMSTAMFTHGEGIVVDIDIWHNCIGQVICRGM